MAKPQALAAEVKAARPAREQTIREALPSPVIEESSVGSGSRSFTPEKPVSFLRARRVMIFEEVTLASFAGYLLPSDSGPRRVLTRRREGRA
jgi:hypothetical protein